MKNQTLRFVIFLSLFALWAVPPAHAQRKSITVNIPFQFYVQDKALPAGAYTIGPSFGADWNGLTIRSRDGRNSASFTTTTVQADENPYDIKVVFSKYGDQYFLSQFYKSMERTGRQLKKSRAERESARQLTERGAEPETVIITALGRK